MAWDIFLLVFHSMLLADVISSLTNGIDFRWYHGFILVFSPLNIVFQIKELYDFVEKSNIIQRVVTECFIQSTM